MEVTYKIVACTIFNIHRFSCKNILLEALKIAFFDTLFPAAIAFYIKKFVLISYDKGHTIHISTISIEVEILKKKHYFISN